MIGIALSGQRSSGSRTMPKILAQRLIERVGFGGLARFRSTLACQENRAHDTNALSVVDDFAKRSGFWWTVLLPFGAFLAIGAFRFNANSSSAQGKVAEASVKKAPSGAILRFQRPPLVPEYNVTYRLPRRTADPTSGMTSRATGTITLTDPCRFIRPSDPSNNLARRGGSWGIAYAFPARHRAAALAPCFRFGAPLIETLGAHLGEGQRDARVAGKKRTSDQRRHYGDRRYNIRPP